MRVLLDEQLPIDLAAALTGHTVATVVGRGWAGIKNGDLLRRMRGEYEALGDLPFGMLLVVAPSNRILHLRPLIPAILEALPSLEPGRLHRVGG